LRLSGRFELTEAASLWEQLRKQVEGIARDETLIIDMSQVEAVDGGAMALLVHTRTELLQRGVKCELVDAEPHVQEIIHLYRGDVRPGRRKRRKHRAAVDELGEATVEFLLEIKLALAFWGQLIVAAVGVAKAPRTANWREVFPTMERSGADAVPIIMLINLLVGLVMAFQSAAQLKNFGAHVYVADLIGISMTRELGPLMTAIVVCGRTGAAFAAELGSMRVNEEIDALRTMGYGPMRFLVLPRTLAMMLVLPMLTLVADVLGILGGLWVAVGSLDLSMMSYFNRIQASVKLWDIYSGLIKSVVFGFAIAMISCQQGLAATGGAEGVGRRTTSAVVSTLFTLIVIDAILTVFFRAVRT
jgi:phospholipid/cholesterol/gamma-HCH transport system permease protein